MESCPISISCSFSHGCRPLASILRSINLAVLEKMSSFAFRFHINNYGSTEREIYEMGGLLG